jgi:hypothetical protein
VLYYEPAASKGPSLTFQNACHLQQGDKVDLMLICID